MRDKIIEIMARARCCGSLCLCPANCEWDTYRFDAETDRAALSDAGYRIVPAEPTEEMIAAYWDSMADIRISVYLPRDEATKIRYRAMLAAAGGIDE